MVRVEAVPPPCGLGVEALGVKGRNGMGALSSVLGFGVAEVRGRGRDVVPGVEVIDGGCGEEVAGAELEGGAGFFVVPGGGREVGGKSGGGSGGGVCWGVEG